MSKNLRIYFAIVLLVLPAAGCAVKDRGWVEPRPLGKDIPAYHPPMQPEAGAADVSVEEPTGNVTLRQALALALLRNPDLASTSWDVRMSEARRLQASLPPNPEVAFDMDLFSPLRLAEKTLQLGQVIFLSPKLQQQTQVAVLQRDLAGWDYEARRIRAFTDTAKAFVVLRAAQEQVSLAEELLNISQKMAQTASERVRSGKASPLEEMKARVELGNVRIGLEQARQAVPAARKLLAVQWGSTSPQFEKAEAQFDVAAPIPTAEQMETLLAQNPEVARWATEMEHRRAVLRLERSRAIPDLVLAGGWKREGETGRNGGIFNAAIPLPIFDRNQGGIREAEYGVAKARAESQAAQSKVYSELAEAYQALATAHGQALILKNDVLPEAQKAFDASLEGYRQGKFGYLDLLDAQRTLFQAKVQYIGVLADYYSASANVEGLIGQSLDSIGADGAQSQTVPATEPATTEGRQ